MNVGCLFFPSDNSDKMQSQASGSAARLQAILDSAAQAVVAREEGVYAGIIDTLKSLMDAVHPKHLELPPPQPPQPPAKSLSSEQNVIHSQIVYECADFELCIFLFPAGTRLPLHDHPGMTVLTKVLYGTLSMRSFDWEQPLEPSDLAAMTAEQQRQERERKAHGTRSEAVPGHALPRPRVACRRADTVLTPEAPTFCLRPDFANIHSFEAQSACAVLDLIMPPYDDGAGRACHYFTVADESDGIRPLLAVAEPEPGSLTIRGLPYLGPKLRPPN